MTPVTKGMNESMTWVREERGLRILIESADRSCLRAECVTRLPLVL